MSKNIVLNLFLRSYIELKVKILVQKIFAYTVHTCKIIQKYLHWVLWDLTLERRHMSHIGLVQPLDPEVAVEVG